jgi:hypothetical protein
MTNFNNGKIYKIEPICDHDEGDIYIGSTTKRLLCQRMASHKCEYKKWKNGLYHKLTSFDIFDKYGLDNVKIVLIEFVNAYSRVELFEREAYFIKNLKCVNKKIPNRTAIEYQNENKEKIKQYHKLYNNINKEKIKEWQKNNKEKVKQIQKRYYEKSKLKKTMEI